MGFAALNPSTMDITAPQRPGRSPRDGRTLACLEVGDPNGPLVIHNHGGPSSRIEARLFAEAASKHGLRLRLRRPSGYRTIRARKLHAAYAGWAADLTAIADALGHREFGVTGWSEGGPWALAAAAYIDPARLRHVSNIAGGCYGTFGDNWAADRLSKADALGGFLALHFEPGFRLMYAAIGITAEHFRATYFKALQKAVNDDDRAILLATRFRIRFLRRERRMLRARQRGSGARQRVCSIAPGRST